MAIETLKRISRGILYKGFATGLVTLLGFATSIILARYFGKNEYGKLIIVYTVVSFFAIFTNFGIGEAMVRFLPKYISTNNQKQLNIFAFSSSLLVLIFSAVFSIVLFKSANLIAFKIFNQPDVIYIIQIGSLYLFCYSLLYYLNSIFQGLQDWKIEAVLSIFSSMLYFIGVLLLAWNGIRVIDAVLITNICACGVSIVLGVIILSKKKHLNVPDISFNPIFKTIKDTLSFSHPLLITSFTFYLIMWFDRLILGASATNEALSMYYVATMIIGGFMMMFKVLFEVLSPFVAEIDPSNKQEIRIKFQFLFKWFFHLAIFFVIVMFYIVDPMVIMAYGKSWAPSALIMKALLFAFLLRGASNPIRMFLINVFQETKKVANISILVLVTNVIMSLLLIPLFSYWGAVVSTITSLVVAWIYIACYIKVVKEMLPLQLIFKTSISVLILILINLIFAYTGIFNTFILITISLVLFILLQIMQGQIKKQDLQLCIEVVKANKIL